MVSKLMEVFWESVPKSWCSIGYVWSGCRTPESMSMEAEIENGGRNRERLHFAAVCQLVKIGLNQDIKYSLLQNACCERA